MGQFSVKQALGAAIVKAPISVIPNNNSIQVATVPAQQVAPVQTIQQVMQPTPGVNTQNIVNSVQPQNIQQTPISNPNQPQQLISPQNIVQDVSQQNQEAQAGVKNSFMVNYNYATTPITEIADLIIIAASKLNSSDIHFDPRDNGMMVRFRIDGDCQDYTFVPKAYERNLTTRLKLLANMNITESRLPQDGAIKGTFGDQYLDMRVSALPLNQGEKIVIRILDYTRSLEGIDSLGFHPKNLEKVKRMMGIPNGIILTTGATGSGKSTTTYSILQGLNKPETNIITVEDPIEMNIEGINQVQVNSEIGMTFAAALRSILRQDPNVILIGEIRDSETAQIAVRASITGHLVLSTIHTNNALATVERLLDMDVERYLLSTALSGIISQRLAKMICPHCRFQRETTKYEKKVFKKYMDMQVDKVWDANPKGCSHCRKGYKGRIAVHEVLEIDDEIRNALSNENLEKKELAKMVYSGNTITMLQDALIKCLEGKTSFEEVYRTIEIENEDDENYENEISEEIKEDLEKGIISEFETNDEVSDNNDIKQIQTPIPMVSSTPSASDVQSIPSPIPAVSSTPSASNVQSIPSPIPAVSSTPSASDVQSIPSPIPAVSSTPSASDVQSIPSPIPAVSSTPSVSNLQSIPSPIPAVSSTPSASNVQSIPSPIPAVSSTSSVSNVQSIPSPIPAVSSTPSTSNVQSIPSPIPAVSSTPSTSNVQSIPSPIPAVSSTPSASNVQSIPSPIPAISSTPSASNVQSIPSPIPAVSSTPSASNVQSIPSPIPAVSSTPSTSDVQSIPSPIPAVPPTTNIS